MVPTSCPVTAQVKAEGKVKVAKSAQDKTSLEGDTCTAAHTVGPPSVSWCIVEQGVCWRMWSQLSCALQLCGWSCLRGTPLLLPRVLSSVTPGLNTWRVCYLSDNSVGLYACRCWKSKYFQNRCPFPGFPVYPLLEDGAVMVDCLMKVSLRFAALVTVLFTFYYIRWLLKKLNLSPTVRFWKG